LDLLSELIFKTRWNRKRTVQRTIIR